jgi:D-3-phosphoglycerate dehydrogenase/(S)-sulfolactate dehydrogenase
MEKRRVLITSIFLKDGDDVDRYLRAHGAEAVYRPWHGGRTEDELIDLLKGIDGAIVSTDPFTARVIQAVDRLKVISRTGVGYDAVDVPAATKRGIIVTTTPGVNRHAVADWALALILCCARKVPENLAEVRRGAWARHEGTDLAEKTLGVVGLGTIGKEVAKRGKAFGMRLLAFDLVQDPKFAEEQGIAYVPLGDLLRQSDFVSIHCFLNEATRHLINAERLALMKPTAFLINTARGGIVDTEALCHALQAKRIAGAGLDVFEGEPLRADSPLRALENVYLTPHCAGSTTDARERSGTTAADNLIRALRGERPQGIVNPEVL